MPWRLRQTVWLMIASGFLACVYYNTQLYVNGKRDAEVHHPKGSPPKYERQGFAVYTPGCKIPWLDPFDPSIIKHIHTEGRMQCNGKSIITYVDDNWLRINKTAWTLHYNNTIDSCEYTPFQRGDGDRSLKYNSSVPFQNDTQVHHEFIRVTCFSQEKTVLYRYFHAFVLDKPEVEQRCREAEKRHPGDMFNIITLGMDSMSRSNFVRQMPRTRTFILRQLGGIEMLGYNKVGDNTLPNMAALLAGKYLKESLDVDPNAHLPADFLPLVFRNYSERGYRIIFGEDDPDIATFNYLRKGFLKPPADYYIRPYVLAMYWEKSLRSNYFCLGRHTDTELLIEYVTRLLGKVGPKRHFVHLFLSRMTHDHVNKASSVDDVYYQFLSKAKEKGYLDNTILLFFGDHGMRYGSLRETQVGRLEERLPGLYISFPKRFHEKYPERVKNVRINAHRLTTPFDVHETLMNLINISGQNHSNTTIKRGLSLFEEISPQRTCNDATIVEQWCTCHEEEELNVTDSGLQKATAFLVSKINRDLSSHKNICALLTLTEIRSAQIQKANAAINIKTLQKITYQVTFRTAPGDGLFQATVSQSIPSNNYTVLGDISRINRYAGQSDCVFDPRMRLYCYCKTMLHEAMDRS